MSGEFRAYLFPHDHPRLAEVRGLDPYTYREAARKEGTFTLRPGDLLATGTPSGVGYARTPPWLLQPGDVVEVEVERLGVLRNPVVGNEHRRA